MNKAQTDFADAIFKMNSDKIIISLSKGAKINKSNKKNTINYAIKTLLDIPVDKFNIKFIEVLFDHGGVVCNARTKNSTLNIIINKINNYIDKAKINNNCYVANKNILELLNFILPKGAVIYNHCILDIMGMECGLEIIKLLHKYRACTDLFSNGPMLDYAIKSNNLEIMCGIIMLGGKPNNTQYSFHWYHNTFDTLLCNFRRDDTEKFDRAIYLLLCSGTVLDEILFGRLDDEPNPLYKNKLMSCYNLLQGKETQTNEELRDKNELKRDLMKTMDELIKGHVPKRTIVEQIDIGVQYHIPVPCVDMIYGYQQTESFVQFIDWSKY